MPLHDYPRRWLCLQTRALIPEVNALGLDFTTSEALHERIKADKRTLRSTKATHKEHQRRWSALIRATRREQELVRRGLIHYQQKLTDKMSVSHQPRLDAMQAYDAVLAEALRRMIDARNDEQQLLPPAYKGDLWTLWIPERIRNRVQILFNAIPHDGKRVKKPFQATLIRDVAEDQTRAERKARLATLTDKVSVSHNEGEK